LRVSLRRLAEALPVPFLDRLEPDDAACKWSVRNQARTIHVSQVLPQQKHRGNRLYGGMNDQPT